MFCNILILTENSELNDLIIDKDLCVEWSGEKVVSKDIEGKPASHPSS